MGAIDKMESATQQMLENRLDQLLARMDEMERKLSQKADEVVSVQVLQHRNELEELDQRLNEIELKMELLAPNEEAELEEVERFELQRKPLLRRVASIFTL